MFPNCSNEIKETLLEWQCPSAEDMQREKLWNNCSLVLTLLSQGKKEKLLGLAELNANWIEHSILFDQKYSEFVSFDMSRKERNASKL